ncbi:MAG: hypothetical protein JWM87_1165 [Candidatus Eremiobacteraeota bacterium]|nr:hypothetical protein [Candidatus Eremiobacteraeota bacterium]
MRNAKSVDLQRLSYRLSRFEMTACLLFRVDAALVLIALLPQFAKTFGRLTKISTKRAFVTPAASSSKEP